MAYQCKPVFVRLAGLEPARLTAPDPKSGAAASFATGANYKSVPEVGLEPTRGFPHLILSQARLPITTLRHFVPRSRFELLFPA